MQQAIQQFTNERTLADYHQHKAVNRCRPREDGDWENTLKCTEVQFYRQYSNLE